MAAMATAMGDDGCDYNDNGDVIAMYVTLVVTAAAVAVEMISMTVFIDHQEGWVVLD